MTTSHWVPISTCVFVALAAVACGGDRRSSNGEPIVRDSAGVTIVENTSPALPRAWRLSDTALVTIGGLGGGSGQELFRVVGATRFQEGSIAIANQGSAEVRIFSAAGDFVRAVGSAGGGPGEFGRLATVRAYRGDSMVAWDAEHGRVSVYDSHGNLGRVSTFARGDGGTLLLLGTFGVFSDGTFFMSALNPFFGPPQSGISRSPQPAFRYSATGERLDSIGAFPGLEMNVVMVGSSGVRATQRIFGRFTSFSVGGSRIFIGTNDNYEIGRYSSAGALELSIRRGVEPEPVRSGDRAAFLSSRIEQMTEDQARQYRARYEGNEPPPTYPAYDEIMVDALGNVWVEDYRWPAGQVARFAVFDAEGRWITEVEAPQGITVLEIGTDYVIASWQDPLDVEYVRLYHLSR